MLFDSLCKIVERNLPAEVPMLKEARIFRMERGTSKQKEQSESSLADWEPDERVVQNFRLPYPVIAIEETNARESCGSRCTVFQARGDALGRRLKFIGIGKEQELFMGELTAYPDDVIDVQKTGRVIEVNTIRRWDCRRGFEYVPTHRADFNVSRCDNGFRCVTYGDTATDEILGRALLATRTNNAEEMALVASEIVRLNIDISMMDRRIKEMTTNICFLELMAAVIGVTAINEPARFIVEEQPILKREPDGRKLTRSPYRPHYIVIKPREIRKLLCLQEPVERDIESDEFDDDKKTPRTPHERRGHFRTLHSEKFRHKRGMVLWIKPCWIGPSTAVVGRNRYRVILEEHPPLATMPERDVELATSP